MVKRLSTMQETWVRSLGREDPWKRKWQSTPVLLPGKSHGQRSLVGYSPWGRKELDTTERLHFHFHIRGFISHLYAFVHVFTLPEIWLHGHITNSNLSFNTLFECHSLFTISASGRRKPPCILALQTTLYGTYSHFYPPLKRDCNLLIFIVPVPSIMPGS